MSIQFDDASTQYAKANTPVITETPITIAAWFYLDDVSTGDQHLVSVGEAGAAGNMFSLIASQNPKKVGAEVRKSDGTSAKALTTSTASQDNWHHGIAEFSDDYNRAALIDGGSRGENVTGSAFTPVSTAMDTTAAGVAASLNTNYMSGRLAEAAVWDAVLTSEEHELLASGLSPLFIRPGSLISYWSMGAVSF